MTTLGFADLKDTSLPTLWDEDAITKVKLADGSSFAEMVGRAQAAMSLLNRELLSMPVYSSLYAVQDNMEMEYAVGVNNSVEEATEYSAPVPHKGKSTGHMLPITPYDVALGWTQMYLRNARSSKLDLDIRQMVVSWRKKFQQTLLSRFFTSDANAVGSTSSDVPFADGGSADSTYVPPESSSGEVFLYTHNHFLGYSETGITSGTFDNNALSVAVEHLQEHDTDGPFVAMCSRADIGSWAAVDGFKPPTWSGINYQQSAVERSQFGDIRSYFGAVETDYGLVNLWATPRIPTGNFGVIPITPEDGMGRPLRMRINPNFGFGVNLVPGNWINAPALLVVAFAEFGIGVGNRVGGVCVDLGASSWAAPTIS